MGQAESKYSALEKTLPDAKGKVFAITGTTSGTGFVAARTIANHNGTVFLLNRPSKRSEDSLQKLKEAVPNGTFVPIDCDLQDFASCRRACDEIRDNEHASEGLYCLCNNAGIMAVPDTITGDGYDVQMQTNHLSHFLITRELFPLLEKSANGPCGDARIVQHSSIAREGAAETGLEAPCLTKQEADGMLGGTKEGGSMTMEGPQFSRYSQTKLANTVFCHALNDKLQASNKTKILSLSAHPGVSVTNLADHLMPGWTGKMIMAIFRAMGRFQSAEDGAMGILRCAMAPPDSLKGGTLYGPAGEGMDGDGKAMAGDAVALPARPYETDKAAKDLLWELSETAIGAVFEV
eukprot:CAMPEP_0201122516 /NCGR_PEP_ID=MMETSP0850-20130426/6137_1 /ASSEMBLY_ACC=CAM_ASM_000622 /TAXON_ID=183588 /ORGANISM="Pseudo-nitzschia fraudulenta, Strain WWA7" /LENGTH=348 /DNA_ID=CAMNT_0047389223 /DNA_START=58 /DNA_END=1104 /DNA_ORIENTATION=-